MSAENTTAYGLCECGCGELTTVSKVTHNFYGYKRGEPRRFVWGHSKRVPVDPAPGEAVDHAWAAGIIDGEGCIHITSTKAKRWVHGTTGRVGKVYPQAVLSVAVSQAGEAMPPMLERLQHLYGGSISKPTNPGGNRRPARTWSVAARKAEAVLLAVEPFLVQKRDQCEIALSFRRDGRGGLRLHLVDRYSGLLRTAKRK